jgi:hypothetical protein
MIDAKRLKNQVGGAADVFEAFSFLFSASANALTTQDLAALQAAAPSLSPPQTGWVSNEWWDSLLNHTALLAQRKLSHRYRLRKPERDELLRMAGENCFADPRRAFFVCLALDRSFTAFREDYAQLPRRPQAVLPVSPAWLRDTTTTPPPLGQMTPVAVCRRWLLNFWFVGNIEAVRTFGEVPRLRGVRLPARTENALSQAGDEGVLRIGFAQWPLFASSDIQATPVNGAFSVTGYSAGAVSDLLAAVDASREAQVHVLIGPELALTPANLKALQHHMAVKAARCPVLSVWGRTHRARSTGGFANEALLLDSHGKTLLVHEKLEAFTEKNLGVEDIVPRESSEYLFADSPLGRLVLNVCRDVRSDLPMILNRAIGASFLAVPAFSKSLNFALEEAMVLGARQLAIVASTNAGSAGLDDRAFAYAPIRGGAKCSVRWTTAGTSATPLLVAELARTGGMGALSASPQAL